MTSSARIAITVYLASLLGACYGTKPPPPQRSLTGPPGVGAPLPFAAPRSVPQALPDLLAAYRLALIEQAHHLPGGKRARYADLEIASLTSRYEGRESDLTAELASRLQDMQPMRASGPAQTPLETVSGKKKGEE